MKKTAVIFSLFSFLYISPVKSNALLPTQVIDINTAIYQVISAETHPYIDNPIFSSYKKVADDLYFLSPQFLLWINPKNAGSQAIDSAFQLLTNAKANGLNPEYYDLSNLQTRWRQLKSQKTVNYTEYALLDTAITINLIHFLSDLRFGRINSATLETNYNSKNESVVLVPILLKAIENNEISLLNNQVEPSVPAYHQLKKALLDYQNKDSQRPIMNLKYITSLHPNDVSPQIINLRRRLNTIDPSAFPQPPSPIYDQHLVQKIKQFQFHHGLKEDGIIGRNTINALNIPPSQHIQMIKLALERFRWLPKIKTRPLIMVNIPAFQLKVIQSGNEDTTKILPLNMKVIVGKSKEDKFKSPVFSANMYYIEFSPYWNIPKSITADEILPKLQENPLYLEEHNMELVSGFHNDEVALNYTEDSFEKLQSGDLMLRQRPGKGNALGNVKFIFPNNYNVYLHDTPSRYLFRKSKRDLSHGCIRVEKPIELAQFLLQTRPGWDRQEIIKAMHLPSPEKVRLKKAVPVIIYYSTVAIVQGNVIFYNDIYNYDTKLAKALMKHPYAPTTLMANVLTVDGTHSKLDNSVD